MQVAKDEEAVLSWTVSTSGRRNGKFTNPYCPVASPYAGKRRGSQPKHSIRKPQIQKWAREQPSRTRKGYVSMICGYIQHSLTRQDRVAHLDESPSCNLNSTTGAGSRGHLEAFAVARSERNCTCVGSEHTLVGFCLSGNSAILGCLKYRHLERLAIAHRLC